MDMEIRIYARSSATKIILTLFKNVYKNSQFIGMVKGHGNAGMKFVMSYG